jgi:2-polyprenyl-3-methyl-5-hydroxy-6-metoxy-1,4-benzoquinol methylase
MYDSFSQEYDHFVNWHNRLAFELPFLLEQIKSANNKPAESIKVMDTATGTGMHAIALAQKGFIASGVDISEGMIETARQNAASANVDVSFTTAAFGEIATKTGAVFSDQGYLFDVLLCLGNSLPHVDGHAGLLDALRDFAACLRPGGLLILQNRNFDSVLAKKERWMEPQSYKSESGETLYLRFYDFLPDGFIQFNILTLKHAPDGQWTQSVMETRLFPITRDMILPALEKTGFTKIQLFGGLTNTPFDDQNSGNLVVTAIKI